MSERFSTYERELCRQFAEAVHGPKRNGLFAVWLILRVAGDAVSPTMLSERGRRRRAEALTRRLASLTLPGGLRPALKETAQLIGEQPLPELAALLQGLAPRVRDTLGSSVAALLLSAADTMAEPN